MTTLYTSKNHLCKPYDKGFVKEFNHLQGNSLTKDEKSFSVLQNFSTSLKSLATNPKKRKNFFTSIWISSTRKHLCKQEHTYISADTYTPMHLGLHNASTTPTYAKGFVLDYCRNQYKSGRKCHKSKKFLPTSSLKAHWCIDALWLRYSYTKQHYLYWKRPTFDQKRKTLWKFIQKLLKFISSPASAYDIMRAHELHTPADKVVEVVEQLHENKLLRNKLHEITLLPNDHWVESFEEA